MMTALKWIVIVASLGYLGALAALFRVVEEDFHDFEIEGSVDLIWLKQTIAKNIRSAERNGLTLFQIAEQNKQIVKAI